MMLIPNRPFEIEPILTAMRAAKGGGTGQHRAGHEEAGCDSSPRPDRPSIWMTQDKTIVSDGSRN